MSACIHITEYRSGIAISQDNAIKSENRQTPIRCSTRGIGEAGAKRKTRKDEERVEDGRVVSS